MIQTIVAENSDMASRHAADIVFRQLEKKPNSVFMLPTGSTPLKLYSLLAEIVESGKISFSKAITFNLDEYLGISKTHKQSYHRFMWENFFGKIDINRKNVSIPEPNPKNTEKFCKAYEKKIKKAGLDIAVLGIGQNGHIGFNEPGTSFESKTHVAELTKSTIKANSRFFKSEKQVPKKAITAGLKTIMQAKKVIVLAFGKNKAKAVKEALEGKVSEKVPASILQRHKNTVFVLNKEAASMLKKKDNDPPLINGIKIYSDFNLPKGKKIAFFSPHPDDASISAGAILSSLAEKNKVFEIIMTTGHRAINGGKTKNQRIFAREKETRAETRILGTKPIFLQNTFYDNGKDIMERDIKKIRKLMKKIKPDIVFVPQRFDTHPTHILARKTAVASIPHNVELWAYETPWAMFGYKKFNACFQFSEKTMRKKLNAVKMHKSQVERTRFDTAAKNIAEIRRITIAEQMFSQHGKKPLETKPFLELYNISKG